MGKKHNQHHNRSAESTGPIDFSVASSAGPLEEAWQGCPQPKLARSAAPVEVQDLDELEPWLVWLCDAAALAPGLHLQFSAALGKEQRAQVRKLVEGKAFSARLQAISSGVGEARSLSVHAAGQAPEGLIGRSAPPHVRQRAQDLLAFARAKGQAGAHSVDEVAEALMAAQAAGPSASQQQATLLPGSLGELHAVLERGQGAVEALLAAVHSGDEALLQELAREHQEVLTQGVPSLQSGDLPLQAAARSGRHGAMRALLDAGAPLEARDLRGNTPLQVSRLAEETDSEAILLQQGALDEKAEDFPLPQDLSLEQGGFL